MTRWLGLLTPALLLAFAFGHADAAPRAPRRKPAPDFTLADSSGATVHLASYKGQVVLVDFWATWCTGCKVEIPWFVEFDGKYRKQGLRSIGVALDEEGWQVIRPYLQRHPISYPIVAGDAGVATAYSVTSMPMTVLIDRRGNIAEAHVGLVDKGAWEKRITQLLEEPLAP
jgi:cytochrome c biogenesis protein CcmG/thiol:disulfide interchange protein DsbE